MQKKICLLLVVLLQIFSVHMGLAEMRPAKKIRAGIPPFDVIKESILANRNNASGVEGVLPSRSEKDHTPFLTWLADSDDRIQPHLISVDPTNTVYTVRNLANQLPGAEGAVDYGIRLLHTPVLLITGNSDNQAIRLFMEGYAHLGPDIRKTLDHLHIPLTFKQRSTDGKPPMKEESFDELWLNNVERNVDFQVALALDRYRDRVEDGRLVVVGGVIDLVNGYGHGAERLIIININGEQKEDELRRLKSLSILTPELMKIIGRKHHKSPEKAAP